MKSKNKKGARVNGPPSRNPRNPRKAAKSPQTAAEKRPTLLPRFGARRVAEPIEMLHRRGHIDRRQRAAAETYRDAAEGCGGSIPCALDIGRIRGPAGPGSPTEAQLRAAERLAEAERILGLMDSRIVWAVAVEGFTIEEVAARMFAPRGGGRPSARTAAHVGRRLREALEALAAVWSPLSRPPLRAARAPGTPDEPPPDGPRVIERGRVAHATRRRIFEI